MLIAIFYLCVIRKLRVTARGTNSLVSRRSRIRESANRRIEFLVIGVICTYTICWLPYWISQLYVSFESSSTKTPAFYYLFILIATSLSYTNSALNPILYAFLSDNFKRRCAEIFRSIYSIRWLLGGNQQRAAHLSQPSTHATTFGLDSEVSRPESRRTLIMADNCMQLVSASQLNLSANHSEQAEQEEQHLEDARSRHQSLDVVATHQLELAEDGLARKKSVSFSVNNIVLQSSSQDSDRNSARLIQSSQGV